MARFVRRGGQWVHSQTGEAMLTEDQRNAPVSVPYVVSDIPEYASPIDGRMITSRSERRYDLERSGCVPYEPSMSPTKGRLKNASFAKKIGREVSEEFR